MRRMLVSMTDLCVDCVYKGRRRSPSVDVGFRGIHVLIRPAAKLSEVRNPKLERFQSRLIPNITV